VIVVRRLCIVAVNFLCKLQSFSVVVRSTFARGPHTDRQRDRQRLPVQTR